MRTVPAQPRYSCSPDAGHPDRNAPDRKGRRGLRWPAPRDRRADRSQLRRHADAVQRGRCRDGQRGPHRRRRGPRRHRLQVRGGHPGQRALDPQVGRSERRGRDGGGGRRPRPHEGGPGRPPHPLQEARPLREGLAPHRGCRRVGRAGHRDGHRGRQGRPDHRSRRPRLPAGFARGHPPGAEPRRVHEHRDRVQGHRAQPLAQQRRPVPARRARGGAQGAAPGDPRPPRARPHRRGPDLEHRRLRRVRGPQRHRRPDPHLRAVVVAREPPVGGPGDRRHRERQGARHRPRPPAHLPGPQADPGGSVAAGRRHVQPGRRAGRHRHEGRDVRRVRRDPRRRRGPRAHLRARAPPRRVPAGHHRAGRRRPRQDPRDRLRAPPPVPLDQASRGPGAAAARAHARGDRGGQPRRRARAGPV